MELTIEKIENLTKSIIQTITMYRINHGTKRGYVTVEPFGVYSGLTGALGAATFKGDMDNKRIEGWRNSMIAELGTQEKQEAYLNTMADFGQISHEVLVRIKDQGHLDWGYEQEYAANYFRESAISNGIVPSATVIQKQVFEFCKGAASLLQFVYDSVVEIYAIESMAKSDTLQIATPIDLVCKIKEKGGDVMCSINMKTSNQFFDHQREQAAMEKWMWNQTYPKYQVEKTGLFRAKSWLIKKGQPTYEIELLNEVDEATMLEDALDRLALCKKSPRSTYLNFPQSIMTFLGKTNLGEQPKIGYKTIEEAFTEALSKGN